MWLNMTKNKKKHANLLVLPRAQPVLAGAQLAIARAHPVLACSACAFFKILYKIGGLEMPPKIEMESWNLGILQSNFGKM